MEREAAALLSGLGHVPSMREVFRCRVGGRIRAVDALPIGDAAATRDADGTWLVYVLRSLDTVGLREAIAHEVAEIHLDRLGFVGDVEDLAVALGDALTMPRDPFLRAAWRDGLDAGALAASFMVRPSSATRRLEALLVARGTGGERAAAVAFGV